MSAQARIAAVIDSDEGRGSKGARSGRVWPANRRGFAGVALGCALAMFTSPRIGLASAQIEVIFPGHATQGQRVAEFQTPAGCERVSLTTARGEHIVALFGPALTAAGQPHPSAARQPTLLFFYGNAMYLAASLDDLQFLRKCGVNVLIPEYVGYGLSEGSPSERGCYATADAAYDYLLSRSDVNPRKIVAAGWSLGSAVAIDLATRKPVAGVVILSAFTSMVDMSRLHFPLLPANILLRHRFPSEQKIAQLRCPILIVHGKDDRLIPHAMSDRLAAAARAPVSRVSIEGAGHNDLFSVGGSQISQALRQYLETFLPARGEE